MKINTRLMFGFVSIALFIGVIGASSLYQLNELGSPLIDDIPSHIQNLGGVAAQLILISTIAISILVIWLAILTSSSISKPIAQLRDAAIEMGKGNLEVSANVKTNDEIGDLATSFNQMTSDLKQYQEKVLRPDKGKTTELEKVVKRKTAQLNKKLLEEEQTSKAMLHMLEDIDDTNKELRAKHDELKKKTRELEGLNEELKSSKQSLVESNVQMEEAVVKLKELDKMKSEFVSNVSHELRTPLTAIKAYNQLLYDEDLGRINNGQKKSIKAVLDSADHLAHILNDILDISKMESGKMEFNKKKVDVPKILNAVIGELRPLAEKKLIKIYSSIQKGLPTVKYDDYRLNQVLVNLLGNSIKFNRFNGIINIDVRIYKKDKNFIIIEIKDTGVGIKKQDLKKIFGKFYQAGSTNTDKAMGTGLGLVVVRQIIEAHEGKVWVNSELGEGTTFSFTLPIWKKKTK